VRSKFSQQLIRCLTEALAGTHPNARTDRDCGASQACGSDRVTTDHEPSDQEQRCGKVRHRSNCVQRGGGTPKVVQGALGMAGPAPVQAKAVMPVYPTSGISKSMDGIGKRRQSKAALW